MFAHRLLSRVRVARFVLFGCVILTAPLAVRADYVPDELIVRFKTGNGVRASALSAVPGAAIKRRNDRHGTVTVKLPKGTTLTAAMAKYRSDPTVEYVGPNHILKIALTPNDYYYANGIDLYDLGFWLTFPQWGLHNDGYNAGNGGKAGADIHAEQAWNITTGSPNVPIAVVDTGIDFSQPDLVNKIWTNPGEIAGNGIDDDGNGYVDDVHGWNFSGHNNDPTDDHVEEGMEVHHGTFVSSVAAASTNNGIGIAGVAWQCPVVPAKVMDANGYGLEGDVADAIYYVTDLGVKTINMSLAGTDDVPALAAAVQYAWDHGALCVCASGNEDFTGQSYPACYPHALAVGASNENDERCTAADWGSGGSNYGSYLSVMAPGKQIMGATNMLAPDYYYFNLDGTSAAAPFVSGVAALIWSVHPDWTNSQVFNQIVLTCDDIGASGWDIETGWGRINAYRALTETTHLASRASTLKTLASTTTVVFSGGVLSTSSGEIPGRLYVQDADGTCGILLSYATNGVPAGLSDGDVVDVIGQISNVSGERGLIGARVTKTGTAPAPKPVLMSTQAMCGGAFSFQGAVVDKRYPSPAVLSAGANNVGKLIKVVGKVTSVTYDSFFLDDGCNIDDGSGNPGVYVYNGDLDRPQLGDIASVTGISSCEYSPGSTTYRRRVLRPRRQSDIQTIPQE